MNQGEGDLLQKLKTILFQENVKSLERKLLDGIRAQQGRGKSGRESIFEKFKSRSVARTRGLSSSI